MAVGKIITCEKCGQSYDEDKEFHLGYCDGGKARKAEKEALDKFNSLPVAKRLEILYLRIQEIEKKVENIPYTGPIG